MSDEPEKPIFPSGERLELTIKPWDSWPIMCPACGGEGGRWCAMGLAGMNRGPIKDEVPYQIRFVRRECKDYLHDDRVLVHCVCCDGMGTVIA